MAGRRDNILTSIDWITVFLWVVLVAFGWMNIYSANIMNGEGTLLDFTQRHGKQLIWISASIIFIAIIFILDAKFYIFFSYILYAVMLIALVAVIIFGKEINGAKSWFVLGGFQFQPSEFAKPFTALALSRLLSSHGFNLKNLRSLALSFVIIFFPAFLILFQPDLGSTLVYFAFLFVLYREGFSQNIMILGATLVLLFILTLLLNKSIILIAVWVVSLILFMTATRPKKILLYQFLPGVGLAGILIGTSLLFDIGISLFHISIVTFGAITLLTLVETIRWRNQDMYKILAGMVIAAMFVFSVDYTMNNILKEHHKQRIYVTLGIEDDPQGIGYNLNQSKIAIGSGGFSGKGFLDGTQTKLQFVPEQATDFIFCTVGEEWGFLGTTFVVLMFVFLLIRLVILAERQRSHFSRVFGYGLISVLLLHFLVNIGMTIGLLPVIGIPLPFFSYGGSSFIAFTVFLFVFLKLDSNRKDLLV